MEKEILIRRGEAVIQATLYGESKAGVILCPPHPLYGGNRFDARLVRIATELAANNISSLALDYHDYTGGEEEVKDVLAAIAYFKERAGSLGLLGYSCGTAVASNAARESPTKIKGIALISPIKRIDKLELELSSNCPKFMVYGFNDSLVVGDFEELYLKARGKKERVALETDHFYYGFEDILAKKTTEFFARVLFEDDAGQRMPGR
jgi:alpha/beta superfamily hydrolase